MIAAGYNPSAHIDVLPDHRIIYVCVPKSASSRIKMSLGALLGRRLSSSEDANNRRLSGLKAPHHFGLSTFCRLAMDARTLRFSFVRNPYGRLVSCWADKFQGKPLTSGDSFVDQYLAARAQIDPSLPIGADKTLSFADFVRFVGDPAAQRLNAHWQLQQELVDGPAITLDFIGRLESFDSDFSRVFDHARADDALRSGTRQPVNTSTRRPWRDYFTAELADRVYRAYERDFDRFHYPRSLSL
jgi:Sulfotransferase family